MLATMVDHVIGIDPDRDWVTASVVDASTAPPQSWRPHGLGQPAADMPRCWSGQTSTHPQNGRGRWKAPAATEQGPPPILALLASG